MKLLASLLLLLVFAKACTQSTTPPGQKPKAPQVLSFKNSIK